MFTLEVAMLAGALWLVVLAQASPWNETPNTQRGLRALPSETGAGLDVLRDRLDAPGPQVTPFETTVLPDGSIRFRDRGVTLNRLGADFDVNDFVERLHGRSAYRFEQGEIAEATRTARVNQALVYRRQTSEQALAALPELLAAVWKESRLDAAARRRTVFQLWDECAEQGPADVVEASARARATITDFIRRQLPAGSPDAFTAAELQSLNARRSSTARFSPYGP